ncbi:hypothetical protein EcoM_01324 [Escherichia coli WV_060327]|nr:hypothetical protein EcoM_01324 [Escherichia coli WV_060327]
MATEDAIVSGDAPGQRGADHDHRKIDLRQRGDWQHTETQYAAQGNGDRQ